MSVGLYRYSGDIYDRDSELTLSENISTQEFYDEHWERAIHKLGISIVRDSSEIVFHQLEDALDELDRLREWAIQELDGTNLEYMQGRVEQLQRILPNAFVSKGDVLYIF
ncbi:hypothetical protein PAECIP112173_02767 [Paenibacillus sp. JJ-100]|uniref:hypothetical protein n=1 Tax=Paenibacillus sp. JJ-100 TaxID=2974896 RepID=UPI0022FF6348|nr:hypothetical protein [Paenibacillus sp. JJ-100]CAI6080020.1 hypothetical protein PAECIP112173_02767 [Paenibacillus sp. JJ-100]